MSDAVRRERIAAWWDFMKSFNVAERREDSADLVHPRRGYQTDIDDWLVKIWGYTWRKQLVDCMQQNEWQQGRKKFVLRACETLDLPAPPAFDTRERNVEPGSRDEKRNPTNLDTIPVPVEMRRDALFWQSQHIQVEFVVDNLSVAGLANSTLAISNAMHTEGVHQIRRRLCQIYQRHCSYKAGCLDPVDWLAREWNTGADFLASYTGCSLESDVIRKHLGQAFALQFFSDDGFSKHEGGSIGIQLIAFSRDASLANNRHVIGYLYEYIPKAKSTFEMELRALDTAAEILLRAF